MSEECEYPWRDEERLRNLYWGEEMSLREIASHLDTTYTTVRRWFNRHDIKRRKSRKKSTGRHQNEAVLRELYAEKRLSTHQIAERLGVAQSTIRYWLDKHGIEAREEQSARMERLLSEPAPYEISHFGYAMWRTKFDGDTWRLREHRLLAVAEYGFEEVSNHDIHHKNGIPWDNRIENLQLVTPEEHGKIHSSLEGYDEQ